ncbi:MAG: hypothetical protein CMO55_11595 [Verrucomicrobiales bacterium]|nr:hypothetical protein [Verrucomicrobiales bacterium]
MGLDPDLDVGDILRDFDANVDEEFLRDSDFGEKAGETLGNYTLIECLGEGGFGSVWKAKQNQPIRREVALKILKMGMDTREVLARFEQERQVLAMMEHPAIAGVLDAGATPSGRPFFVMELVKEGKAITQYCSESGLETAGRLKLFTAVCEAIQHAHQKGIIHRDLKPTNILVSGSVDSPEVKVIDFGISKATGEDRLTDFTILTRADRMMGTPAYMSPEQLAGRKDVDTRSDLHSLGVLLYELLTETTPFVETETSSAEPGEWARLVRERTPPKPSTLIDGKRSEKSRHLRSELKGDLDCIVLKSLEPEIDRRYDSVGDFAADIQRHLNHEPIEARPRSFGYVAKRFTQRNKAAVIGSVAVLVALLAGLVASSILFLQEKEARRLADLEVERSRQVTTILRETLESAGVSKSLGRDSTMLREILDSTANRIDADLDLQPEIESEIREIVGRTYFDVDAYPESQRQFEQLVALRRETGEPTALAEALIDLGEVVSKSSPKAAEPYAAEALELLRKSGNEGGERWYGARILQAWTLLKTGRAKEALPIAEECYRKWEEDPENPYYSRAPDSLGICLNLVGQKREALQVYRAELEQLRTVHGSEHPEIANALDNYGMILVQVGELDEAEQVLTEALELSHRLWGKNAPDEDHILSYLSKIAGQRGDFERERELLRQAMAVCNRNYKPGHRYRKEIQGYFAKALVRQTEIALKNKEYNLAADRIDDMEKLIASEPDHRIDSKKLAELKAKLPSP